MNQNAQILKILLILFCVSKLQAQVKIGANPTSINSNALLEIEPSTNSKFIVTKDSAKVGIGTASPVAKLDVIGKVKITDGTEGVGKLFVSNAAGVGSWQDAASALSGIEPWFSTTTNTGATSNTENIYSLGKVGIGTTNPIWQLDVRKSTANSELIAHFVNSGGQTTTEAQVAIGGGPGQWMKIVGYNGTLGFRGYNTNAEVVTMKTSGAVGIGTTAPNANLHIFNNISNGNKTLLTLQNGTIQYNLMLADNFNNANYGSIAADYVGNGINNALVFNLGGMGQYIFGDHVGPWANGDYDMGLSFARWRNIYLTNSPNVSSDLRLKSNIIPLEFGLDAVMKLSPKKYTKFNDFDKTTNGVEEYGFIAQEINKVIPLVVTGNETDKNPMGVKYEQIIPVLTKAIQEQQAIIEQLRNELTSQKQAIVMQAGHLRSLAQLLQSSTSQTIEKNKK